MRRTPGQKYSDLGFRVEAMGLEPTNLLTASQALYQLSYAPGQPGTISASVPRTLRIADNFLRPGRGLAG